MISTVLLKKCKLIFFYQVLVLISRKWFSSESVSYLRYESQRKYNIDGSAAKIYNYARLV